MPGHLAHSVDVEQVCQASSSAAWTQGAPLHARHGTCRLKNVIVQIDRRPHSRLI